MIPACIFGAASGASFNPALTLALAMDGSFAWSMVPGYILAQFAGAFVGAVIVYLLFKAQFDATKEAGNCWVYSCTAPSVPNTGLNMFSEAVGTFCACICHQRDGKCPGLTDGLGKFIVFESSCSSCVSGRTDRLCYQSGEGLRPRFAHTVLPIHERQFQLGIRNCSHWAAVALTEQFGVTMYDVVIIGSGASRGTASARGRPGTKERSV